MTPRCGVTMRRYEAVWAALLEDPVCGRPAGHAGKHRTVMGVRRKQAADATRTTQLRRTQRRTRRVHAQLAAIIEAAERSRAA
jgi:hypothetical protein